MTIKENRALWELGEKIDGLRKIPLKPSVIIAISLAAFFTYYDAANYSYIAPVLRSAWGATDAEIATGASLTIIGYVIGALAITQLADLRGRRTAFIVSILLLGIGSLLAAASQNISQLVIFRLITGAGIGSELVVASVYIGEMSPKSKRGNYISILGVLGWVGLTSSGPISLFLIQGQTLGIDGWRLVLGIAGAVALILLPFRLQMPESPRWFLCKGRLDDANQVLQSLGVLALESREASQERALGLQFLKNKKVMLNILFLTAVWLLVYIPIYASLLLVVAYVHQGYSVSESISINTLSGIGFVAGGIMSIVIADRLERKYQIAIASCMLSVGFILRGFLVQDYGGLVMAGFIAFFSHAWLITALLTYTTERFPTGIRSSAAGIVEGSSRGLAAISPFVFVMLEPYGFLNTMVGLSVFSIIAAGIAAAFGLSTRGRSLETLASDSTYI